MSNQHLRFKLEAVPPGKNAAYPSYDELVRRLPEQVRLKFEDARDEVQLLWTSPSPPPAELNGKVLWLKVDEQGRLVDLMHRVGGNYKPAFPGNKVGDLMYRVPSEANTGPWYLADGTNGTTDLSGADQYALGNAKLHEYRGVQVP